MRRTKTSLRRDVLALLAEADATPTTIALVLGLDVATVQQILAELEREGFVAGGSVH